MTVCQETIQISHQAQSDQSPHCPHDENLGPKLLTERKVKTDQTGQMLRFSLTHFVGFVNRMPSHGI